MAGVAQTNRPVCSWLPEVVTDAPLDSGVGEVSFWASAECINIVLGYLIQAAVSSQQKCTTIVTFAKTPGVWLTNKFILPMPST